jgi:hypothetical protein
MSAIPTTYEYILDPKTKLYVKKNTSKGKKLLEQFPDHENYMEIELLQSELEKEEENVKITKLRD